MAESRDRGLFSHHKKSDDEEESWLSRARRHPLIMPRKRRSTSILSCSVV
uniref:ABA-stress ripening protein homolog n=1 Tax=Mesembryanthemum crystallinum TaxID=3544 RepID=O65170_MESCR|nr:ABA-stress ripening protein homolog [Mesembryanthemum crystallinum]